MKRNKGLDHEPGDLIPYYLKGNNTLLLYNDVQIVPQGGNGPTGQTFDITGVPKE
jgi:hypothetical protein